MIILMLLLFFLAFVVLRAKTPEPSKEIKLKLILDNQGQDPCPPHSWDRVSHILESMENTKKTSESLITSEQLKTSLAKLKLLDRLACRKCGVICGDFDFKSTDNY